MDDPVPTPFACEETRERLSERFGWGV
ncbi:hypothetical protein MPC1_1390002 [Methylocella tundrae]|nr:hypothetical protein MPC1_1390002 [Methylocella tundrae]